MSEQSVIFLDIDGVLNSATLWDSWEGPGCPEDGEDWFEPHLVEKLNRITDATGAGIVLSTSWVLIYCAEYLREVLDAVGVTGLVLGVTDRFYACRVERIKAWLVVNGDDRQWIAVDDDPVIRGVAWYCLTSPAVGLSDDNVETMVAHLNNKEELR